MSGAEQARLDSSDEPHADWRRWGPYLSQRQWGTVREDYSADGEAWTYFPFDHAHLRAYRWGEDGLLGISDSEGRLCLALALWNEADPILKERLFGLSGPQGNHGEDAKEYWFFLDNTPTHSYMSALYKYPQNAFPYDELVRENARRGKDDPEYELLDTGVFAEDRYFDVLIEYAKADTDDILMRVSATNRGPNAAPLHMLPTLWCRNTWTWTAERVRPELRAVPSTATPGHTPAIHAMYPGLGSMWLYLDGAPDLLFTDNESNAQVLWGVSGPARFSKDGIDEYVVHSNAGAVNPAHEGTKSAAHYRLVLAPGETVTVLVRLANTVLSAPFADATAIIEQRKAEADAFYAAHHGVELNDEARTVQRRAFAGLLWSKQFYGWDVDRWLDGDPAEPPPPEEHKHGRNADWRHFNTRRVLSMPDTWEYPWFASWDLAFHCLPLALIDPAFAKDQLTILLREWYMHPAGQLPAYEWKFADVNPPVHAWAALRVFRIERRMRGTGDIAFLERVFHKLLINFTWWVNRKDPEGRNVFQGGFLGLDNIGVFDRSATLPGGGTLQQADGTAWMGAFCLNMLAIALELAPMNHAYEDIATKFFQHFMAIAAAMNNIAGEGIALWDDEDEFCYDVLRLPDGSAHQIKVRSLVGLLPLLAVETVEPDQLEQLPDFRERMEWLLENRPHLAALISHWHEPGQGERRLVALMRGHRMKRLLARMLDPEEFLSPYGVRSLSHYHRDHPYRFDLGNAAYTIDYEPAESRSGMFGGNSNWRGPVWFPPNYLLIEALQRFHWYYGDDFRVECPTGSGQMLTLAEVAVELSRRLERLFLRDSSGRRPCDGDVELFAHDPHWRDLLLFHEYFNGDTGAGLGASHQTGWTALVAKLLDQSAP